MDSRQPTSRCGTLHLKSFEKFTAKSVTCENKQRCFKRATAMFLKFSETFCGQCQHPSRGLQAMHVRTGSV